MNLAELLETLPVGQDLIIEVAADGSASVVTTPPNPATSETHDGSLVSVVRDYQAEAEALRQTEPRQRSSPVIRTTHTYATLGVSPEAYREIFGKLRDAGYDHVFHQTEPGRFLIDMHGIALCLEEEPG